VGAEVELRPASENALDMARAHRRPPRDELLTELVEQYNIVWEWRTSGRSLGGRR
jgi:hypothetical protein